MKLSAFGLDEAKHSTAPRLRQGNRDVCGAAYTLSRYSTIYSADETVLVVPSEKVPGRVVGKLLRQCDFAAM